MTADDGFPHSAVVVGAGVGGLAAAAALRKIGWRVTVLERAAEFGEVGAGLSLWPNAVSALHWLGVGAAVESRAVPTVSRGSFRTSGGRWLRRARSGDVGVLAIHRADLHRLLLDALPEGVVRTAATAASVTDGGRAATVTYVTHRQHELSADLVVAADGVDSGVRAQLWPRHQGAMFQMRTVWRGVTPPGAVPPVAGCLTLGRGNQFGVLPLPDDRVYWFLVTNVEEPGVRYPDERAEVLHRVTRWHQPIRAVVHATEPDHVLHDDVVDLDPVSTYVGKRVVLLGDAAHGMTPDLGQGACQAVEDAVVLAHQLATQLDLSTALAAYDEQRRERTQPMADAARRASIRSSSTSGGAYLCTALALRLMPPRAWRRAVARWSEWSPPPA